MVLGYSNDGRAEKSERAVRQPRKSSLGWKGQRKKVVLPEPKGEDHQADLELEP